MRPGRGLKYREGWVRARHMLPAKPNMGGKSPTSAKPLLPKMGEGGALAGSTCVDSSPVKRNEVK